MYYHRIYFTCLWALEIFTLPIIFCIDSIWILTSFHGLDMDNLLAGNPANFLFHAHYEIHMECLWNFVDTSCPQVWGCSNSWTMWLLKDIKLPSINCALDWSCPKWTLANSDAQFEHHQQCTMLFLNHHHHHPQHSPTDTNDTMLSDGDNTRCCHHVQ